jgi:hypothetical protein
VARVKGTALIHVVKALRSVKDEARPLLPEHLHRYLKERILAASWYPLKDLVALVGAVAQVIKSRQPEFPGDVFTLMGRAVAREDLSGVYAQLLKRGNPQESVLRAASLWRTYFDTGSLSVSLIGPGRARVELDDFGVNSPEMCRVLVGWFSEFAEMTGVGDVSFIETQCRCRGDPSHVWEIEWEASTRKSPP